MWNCSVQRGVVSQLGLILTFSVNNCNGHKPDTIFLNISSYLSIREVTLHWPNILRSHILSQCLNVSCIERQHYRLEVLDLDNTKAIKCKGWGFRIIGVTSRMSCHLSSANKSMRWCECIWLFEVVQMFICYCYIVTLSHCQVYTGEGISLASRHRVQFSEVLIVTNDVTW